MQISKESLPRSSSRWSSLGQWLPEAGILAVGLFLYSFQLGHESLWIDEILSIGSAQGYLDLNRPLYFVLLRYWLRVSQDETWLRSLSVLFGLGSLGLTYQLGRLLINRKGGLVAALLFALSPLAISQAQEVRFYMMSLFWGVAGSLLLAITLKHSNRRSQNTDILFNRVQLVEIALWMLCRCLGFLTAQPNALLLIPDLLIIAGTLFLKTSQTPFHSKKQTHLRSRWLWALALLTMPLAIILKDVAGPLIEFLLTQKWYAGAAGPPTLSNLVGMMATLTAWPLQGPEYLGAGFFFKHLFNLYAVSMLGLLTFSLWSVLRQQQDRLPMIWLALWGLIPVALVFLMSQVFPFLWLERYCAIAIPYIAILLAAGYSHLWQHRKPIAILAATLYFVTISGPLVRYYTTDYHANWRGLSEEITQSATADDVVVVYPGSFMPYIDYYYDGETNFLPREDTDNYQDVNIAELVSEIESFEGDRFWLVCPVKEQWQDVRDELAERLEMKGFLEEKESQQLDHRNWGPTLTLFSMQSDSLQASLLRDQPQVPL